MNKHTQGEWVVYVPEHIGCTNVAIGGDKYFGQFIELWHHQNSKEQSEANAKLIAASPDLLENLTRILDRIKENNMENLFPSAFERAKAAIKKAKGE